MPGAQELLLGLMTPDLSPLTAELAEGDPE
jgi:hypothetical protein